MITGLASRGVQAGHVVPEATVRRRFAHGIENFHHRYQALVDTWLLYDNAANPPALLAEGGLT